jgi:cyclopropane fatty-acyl-phospholipid synthase-like methyltransferase
MDKAVVQEYFNRWSIYDQVLDHNYMFHDELYQEVQRLIMHRYAERTFSLVDLGCGSARHLAPVLANASISHYVGFDISEIAITYATGNLASLNCSLELHQTDLLEGLHRLSDKRFDAIFSSFALHHLAYTDKAAFFKLTNQMLLEEGMLILVDLVREEEEDYERWVANYCNWLKSDWKAIPSEAIEAILDHIGKHDFPETTSTLYKLAKQAGFRECFNAKHFHWHRILCFEKATT